MLFCLSACGEKEDDYLKNVNYSCEKMTLVSLVNDYSVEISEEEKNMILVLLNNGKWSYSTSKGDPDYYFYLDGEKFGYICKNLGQEIGAFEDYTNYRHMFITAEQKAPIDEFIDKYVNPLIIGMTISEIEAVEDFEFVSYKGYVFAETRDGVNTLVAELDENEKIVTVNKYDRSRTNSSKFEKIEIGMDVHDVVKRVGIPSGHSDNETIALNYVTYEKDEFKVVFDNEMKVTEVVKVE